MKHILIALALIALCLPLLAQKADDITGEWYNSTKITKLQIYKTAAGSYAGKIIWLKDPKDANGKPKLDEKNPDKKLRDRGIMNLVILTGLDYKNKNNYEGGRIYDPQSGNTYKCKAELVGGNSLKLRGYIGVSLIGRTEIWTRAK
ncbi:MAG: DUF2147 domain-containing protein [Candidatus Cloacimonetes bacterium]|nr:DUF2147 domain-containing protein [Candidatus Cloacimonadota bacterium]